MQKTQSISSGQTHLRNEASILIAKTVAPKSEVYVFAPSHSKLLRVRRVIKSCCHIQPSKVDLTGSMRRGTAASGEFDLDMRVELREQDWGSLNLLKQQARQQLSAEGVRVIQEGQHILKLNVVVGAVKFQ